MPCVLHWRAWHVCANILLSPLINAGAQTINSMYGTRVAVLAGDFLFAQSSWFLANLDNLEVIKLISQVHSVACSAYA